MYCVPTNDSLSFDASKRFPFEHCYIASSLSTLAMTCFYNERPRVSCVIVSGETDIPGFRNGYSYASDLDQCATLYPLITQSFSADSDNISLMAKMFNLFMDQLKPTELIATGLLSHNALFNFNRLDIGNYNREWSKKKHMFEESHCAVQVPSQPEKVLQLFKHILLEKYYNRGKNQNFRCKTKCSICDFKRFEYKQKRYMSTIELANSDRGEDYITLFLDYCRDLDLQYGIPPIVLALRSTDDNTGFLDLLQPPEQLQVARPILLLISASNWSGRDMEMLEKISSLATPLFDIYNYDVDENICTSCIKIVKLPSVYLNCLVRRAKMSAKEKHEFQISDVFDNDCGSEPDCIQSVSMTPDMWERENFLDAGKVVSALEVFKRGTSE